MLYVPRPLRLYQKPMFRYCITTKHPALFVQMRLGKTLVTVRAVKYRRGSKVLIVAPYSALYSWWLELLNEREKDNGVVEVFGPRDYRLQLLQDNYSSARWFLFNREGHRSIPEIADYYFDHVILDESTFIKSVNSQATEFYCDNFRDAEHRFVLTGTPAPESELDYFCQLHFLDHDIWNENKGTLKNCFYTHRHKWFGIINHTAYLSPQGSKYLEGTLARNCFFLSRSDVNLGGEKIYEKRFIRLTGKVRKIYEKIEKEFVLSYMSIEQDTIYATTKYVWLRRLCGGFVDKVFVSYVKLKELELLLNTELKGEKVIIVAKHVAEVKQIKKYLGKKKSFKIDMIYGGVNKRKRNEIVTCFQTGKLDAIVAQPETIKHGTNLSASDTIIFYTTPDGGETRMQVEDRPVDTSTQNSTLIIDLICKDTVEEDVLRSLSRKESRQTMMKNLVQRLQKKYGLKGREQYANA